MTPARCDACGQPIAGDIHEPHNPGCPRTGDCTCDNQVCADCCPDCREVAA